jgi:hypothetical protein
VVAFGLASITVAHAVTYNGDLLVGFTVQNGNDLVYDLASEGSLTDGENWNLSAALTAAGINTTGLASAQWGVVGNNTTGDAWLTYAGPGVPPTINTGIYAKINTADKTLVINDFGATGPGNYTTPSYTLSYSWYSETDQGAYGGSSDYASVYVDPNWTGTGTNAFYQVISGGAVTQLGTFSINSSGVLTYHVFVPQPPPPRIVSAQRSGNTSTIYFTTTNGFTYTLYYTNSAGLTASTANWPSSTTTVTGNGQTNSLSDTTTDSNRFYQIGVH